MFCPHKAKDYAKGMLKFYNKLIINSHRGPYSTFYTPVSTALKRCLWG